MANEDLRAGLRMAYRPDAKAREKEADLLREVAQEGGLAQARAYWGLGDDRPEGPLANVWITGMAAGTILLATFFVWYLMTSGPAYFDRFFG